MPPPDEFTVPPPPANLPPVNVETREMLLVLCRSMLMFIQWANKRYSLGMQIREPSEWHGRR